MKNYRITWETKTNDKMQVIETGYITIVDTMLFTIRKYNVKTKNIKSIKIEEL